MDREEVNAGRNDNDDDRKVDIGGNSIKFHTCKVTPKRAREGTAGPAGGEVGLHPVSLGDERRTMLVHLVPPALFSFAAGGRGVNFH